MNTRSCAENCVATRCPTALAGQDDSGGTNKQERAGARTDVERPPIDLPRLLDLKRMEGLLRDLEQLLRTHLALVDAAGTGVDDVAVRELDVQPDQISLARDDHARAVVGVDRALAPDVREIGVGDHVDNAPDVVRLLAV